MNYRTVNGVKDIQVLIKEAGVYTGSIDGVWGKGTQGGVLKLFQDYHLQMNQGRTSPLAIASGADDAAAVQGIKDIQSNLKLFNLYTGAVDGIPGEGTFSGFFKVFYSYRAANKTPVYDLAWSKRVQPPFIKRVRDWTASKGYWLNSAHAVMACICFESAGTFRPDIKNNAGADYWGLIQFGNAACQDMAKFYKTDITLDKIKAMSQMDQLEWVFKYFEMWEGRGKVFKRLEDFYLTIFYPSAVGKGPDEVLFTKASEVPIIAKSYLQNSGFDINKDGAITIGEICTRLYTTYYDGLNPSNRNIISA